MAVNLSPQDGGDHGPTNGQSGGGNESNNLQKGSDVHLDTSAIWDVVGGIILGFIGVGLADAGFHTLAFVCYFAAVACGIFALNHIVKSKLKYARALFWSLLVADFALFSFLSWHVRSEEEPVRTPNLNLVLIGKTNIWLTNSFMFVTGLYHTTNFPGNVLVSFNANNPIGRLPFAVVNDTEESEAKSVQVIFLFDKQLTIAAQKADTVNWTLAEESGNTFDQGKSILFPFSVPSGLFELPDLYVLDALKHTNEAHFAKVLLKCVGAPQKELAFWILLHQTTNEPGVQFITPTNGHLKEGPNTFDIND